MGITVVGGKISPRWCKPANPAKRGGKVTRKRADVKSYERFDGAVAKSCKGAGMQSAVKLCSESERENAIYSSISLEGLASLKSPKRLAPREAEESKSVSICVER